MAFKLLEFKNTFKFQPKIFKKYKYAVKDLID